MDELIGRNCFVDTTLEAKILDVLEDDGRPLVRVEVFTSDPEPDVRIYALNEISFDIPTR